MLRNLVQSIELRYKTREQKGKKIKRQQSLRNIGHVRSPGHAVSRIRAVRPNEN